MQRRQRKGATLLLMTVMILAVVILAGVTIDLAYLQLLRTQQKVAVDAAVKAAVEAMERTESQDDAIAAAKNIASLHEVGGRPFSLRTENIQFGTSNPTSSGSYTFLANETPVNAVRIVGELGYGTSDTPAAIPMFFPRLGHKKYQGTMSSAASFIINEVMLCLDRSGSMKFDMTGATWSYPPNNPYVSNQSNFWNNYYGRPHPSSSRWAVLMDAVEVFMDEAEVATRPPRVGLVTWSSSSAHDGAASTDYALPPIGIEWDDNRQAIQDAFSDRAQESNSDGVFGGTELANGLTAAVNAIQSNNSHDSANRIIILLSDGDYQGPDPISVATAANNEGITIHSIALIAGSTFNKLQEIAQETGGNAYMATDSDELQSAFRDIARSLNIILTE